MKLPLSWLSVALPLMSTPLALLPEIRLPCGGRTNTPFGRDRCRRSPRRRSGCRVDAVVTRMPFSALPRSTRAGDIRADVVHGDLVVVGPVQADAVAAVAADHVRQLEADVDRRLVGNVIAAADHDADHLIAVHRIGTGDVRGRVKPG